MRTKTKTLIFDDYKLYVYKSIHGNSMYKLHKGQNETYSFIDLKSSVCHADGFYDSGQAAIDSKSELFVFNNIEAFALFLTKMNNESPIPYKDLDNQKCPHCNNIYDYYNIGNIRFFERQKHICKIPYKDLTIKIQELLIQIGELKQTIHYYKQSIETYKRIYNTEKQRTKKC